jgi:DNA-binding MarR family transcriptional regulator
MRASRKTAAPTAPTREPPSTARALLTEIVLEVFRLNGSLITAGNALADGTGLTSARWQVLGALAIAGEPRTVARIARAMGLTRQAVQRLVDELEAEGIVRRLEHPESRRARPVELTIRGASLYDEMTRRQRPWADRTAAGIPAARLRSTLDVLRAVRTRLEKESAG